jgi:hypothetical protein
MTGGTMFRTLDGQTVVGVADTHYCRGCDGNGSKRGRPCGSCAGSGRLLNADQYVWPVPVVPVEDMPEGEAAPECLQGATSSEQPVARLPFAAA